MKVVYCEACGEYKYQPNSAIGIPFESKHGLTSTWRMCNKCYEKHCGGKGALEAALANGDKPAKQGVLQWLVGLFSSGEV